jgi:NAD(P)-dependent dehydrogenase (short-subunit alcohol dehydrogenase family)
MDIRGKNALVLGGFGLVGNAVCRQLLAHEPARLVVSSLRKEEAEQAVAALKAEFPNSKTKFFSTWGDIFLRAEWQAGKDSSRAAIMADAAKRKRLVGDIVDELNDEILEASLLYQIIQGKATGLDGSPAQIVVDCINTSTAVAYQNIYATARRLEGLIADGRSTADGIGDTKWPEEVEQLLAALYIPQLVRHIQILHESMLQADTQAYVKVGTSGTGGMGLNIPYTHGEEKPSRVLMSKAALAGAQTLLTFLMARTPGGPEVVKEIKPTALIAWKEIGYGPIRRGGQDFLLYDCPPDKALPLNADNLKAHGEFGKQTGEKLEAVFINTGENGLFAAGDFAAITAYGQMQFVTPEEIANNVVREIMGGNTGRDVIGALDGSVMGPTFRAGQLRDAALERLRQLGEEHGESVAFEILGPPRMSKLLYEAFMLKKAYGNKMSAALKDKPEQISAKLEELVSKDAKLRQQIISIGLPIVLADGKRILRGPVLKSEDAEHGWVDLTPANMAKWVKRLQGISAMVKEESAGESSSFYNRTYPALRKWVDEDRFEIGEMVAWVSINEDEGRRGKD